MINKFVVSLIMIFILFISSSTAYTIDNDLVYIDDANVYLSSYPHTISSSGWVYFNFTSKIYTGNVDVCWGFDTTLVKPKKAELYHPHWINWTTDHSQFFYNVSSITAYNGDIFDYGNSYNAYQRQITYDQCINFNCTEYEPNTINISFDSYTQDGSNYTIYWHTNHSRYDLWKDVTHAFDSVNYDFQDMNKWYYVQNVPINANNDYTVRVWVELPISLTGISSKYFFAIKPSGETIHQSITNGHFYYLDPWYQDSGYAYRKEINITGESGAGTHYQVNFTIGNASGGDFNLSGHSINFPSDVRFADDDGSTALNYWIEDETVDPIIAWVNVTDDLSTSQDIYCYYGKSGVSDVSDGDATFLFFDDFPGASIDANKWNTGGSPTIDTGVLICTGTDQEHVQSKNTFLYKAMRTKTKMTATTSWSTNIGFTESVVGSDTNLETFWVENADNTHVYSGNATDYENTIIGDFDNVWYTWDILWKTGEAKFYVNGNLEDTDTTYVCSNAVPILVQSYRGAAETRTDWIFVREYNSPEPAFTSAGGEESAQSHIPPNPTTLQNTTGVSWINWTWQAGSGNTTDSYNKSITGVGWINGSSNTYYNRTSVCMDQSVTILVYAYNNSGENCISDSNITDTESVESLSWANNSYDYRAVACVQNITTDNYQFNFSLHTGSGTNNATDIFMNNHNETNDYSDIRIYNQTGIALNYWISNTTIDPTVLWIDATENGSVQIYYGYSDATSASNGTNTFEFFDDFENNNLNRWTSAGGDWSIGSTTVKEGTYAAECDVTVYESTGTVLSETNTFKNIVLTGYFRTNRFDASCGTGYIVFSPSTGEHHYTIALRSGGHLKYYNGAYHNFPNDKIISVDTWYPYKVIFDFDNSKQKTWCDGDYLGEIDLKDAAGTLLTASHYMTEYCPSGSSGWRSGHDYFYLDSQIIRKWQSVEPTITVGVEESKPPSDTSFTVTLPGGYSYAKFEPSNSTHKNCTPNGQTDSVPFYNVTNTGNVPLDIRMGLNATVTNIDLKVDTDNNPTGATILTASLQTIYSNLAIDNNVDIWLWTDLNRPPPQSTNKSLEINITQS